MLNAESINDADEYNPTRVFLISLPLCELEKLINVLY